MPFYNPPKDIEEKIDDTVETIIPVIASFNSDGGIKPLYFRYQDKDITVTSVHYCRPYPIKITFKLVFKCSAVLDNYLRDVQITYWIKERVWTLLV